MRSKMNLKNAKGTYLSLCIHIENLTLSWNESSFYTYPLSIANNSLFKKTTLY